MIRIIAFSITACIKAADLYNVDIQCGINEVLLKHKFTFVIAAAYRLPHKINFEFQFY